MKMSFADQVPKDDKVNASLLHLSFVAVSDWPVRHYADRIKRDVGKCFKVPILHDILVTMIPPVLAMQPKLKLNVADNPCADSIHCRRNGEPVLSSLPCYRTERSGETGNV